MGRRTSRRQPNSAQRSRAQGSGLREGPRASARQANIQIRLVRWRRTPRAIWLRRARAPAARQPVPLPEPATLGPHLIRLRPAAHARARIETYGLHLTPPGELRWQQDPAGNFVARASWPSGRLTELGVTVELAVDIRPVNPFDFTLEPAAGKTPFDYGLLAHELAAYLDPGH